MPEEPIYATAEELRTRVEMTNDQLPDPEAIRILIEAEDLVDARLGVRGVDPETGRKVVPADEDAWRARKLGEATLEVAAVIFSDPDVARRQRARFLSGDVSTNGFYGAAYGERAEALIDASGLRVNRARMSGGDRRRYRHFR
jgi:hypothetical protein